VITQHIFMYPYT